MQRAGSGSAKEAVALLREVLRSHGASRRRQATRAIVVLDRGYLGMAVAKEMAALGFEVLGVLSPERWHPLHTDAPPAAVDSSEQAPSIVIDGDHGGAGSGGGADVNAGGGDTDAGAGGGDTGAGAGGGDTGAGAGGGARGDATVQLSQASVSSGRRRAPGKCSMCQGKYMPVGHRVGRCPLKTPGAKPAEQTPEDVAAWYAARGRVPSTAAKPGNSTLRQRGGKRQRSTQTQHVPHPDFYVDVTHARLGQEAFFAVKDVPVRAGDSGVRGMQLLAAAVRNFSAVKKKDHVGFVRFLCTRHGENQESLRRASM